MNLKHFKKLLYSPDLESLLTSTFIFSIMSDSARLATPTQGSVSMVILDQSFMSEGHIVETMSCVTKRCLTDGSQCRHYITCSENKGAYHGDLLHIVALITVYMNLRIRLGGLLPQRLDLLVQLLHQCLQSPLLFSLSLLDCRHDRFVTLLHGVDEAGENLLALSHLPEVGALFGRRHASSFNHKDAKILTTCKGFNSPFGAQGNISTFLSSAAFPESFAQHL